MRILGIRIKNLASLEGVTEIDFTQEPLSSAGIFAITGPTGAGKSTILDALCRMQVESLFIDEGLDSLDPTTLNIAMDALERLHYQGPKAGVISHVQEMTERIPAQIKVSKMNSGKSKVEII